MRRLLLAKSSERVATKTPPPGLSDRLSMPALAANFYVEGERKLLSKSVSAA
ncbi:MAG TPA: hypothetical protein VII70_11475 [Steroidobacteraceae bacterium]